MRHLAYPAAASPRVWGQIHGETFRGEIQSLAEIRWYLAAEVGGIGRADAEALATLHLPVLARYDAALSEELLGIADGAKVRPEDIVILNHYTDLRDIDPRDPTGSASGGARPPANAPVLGGEGCTALWSRTESGPVLAQTWDMHATAMPYVMLLEVPSGPAGPGAVLLGLTGCLGMCGMNALGVGMAINNLTSTDARVGLVWPALVRRALREATAAAARDVVLAAPLGSGHHYLVADPERVFAIETSGELRKLVFSGQSGSYVHTNHCLDAEVDRRSRVPAGSTTFERHGLLSAELARAPIRDARDAYHRLGSQEGYPRSVCANLATPLKPHLMATCGAISMDLGRREVFAVAGFPHNVEPEHRSVTGVLP